MKSLLKTELSRALKNKAMFFILMLGTIITVSHVIMYVVPAAKMNSSVDLYKYPLLYPTTVFMGWIGSKSVIIQCFIYYALLPLLATIPFADSFFTDRKGGYIKNVLIRVKKRDYFISKYIAVFISGGLAVTIPLLINLLLTATLLPSLIPQVTEGYAFGANHMWSKLFFTHPYLCLIGYLLIDFIFSGLIATIGLSVSLFVEYRFMALIMPFIIYIFVFSVGGSLGLMKYIPFYFLQCGSSECSGYVVLGEMLVLLVVTLSLFLGVGVKEDVY